MSILNSLSTVTIFKKIDDGTYYRLSPEELRDYQKILLSMAKDIIEVCDEYGIQYHLTGGTALGAVRHSGFIPWDDDMDIDILGSDFERFVEKFRDKFGEKYWIHTVYSPNYGMTVNRIRLKGSVYRCREDFDTDECGFFIDLMRIENTYDNFILRNIHGFLCMLMGFLLSCRNFAKNKDIMLEIAKNNRRIKSIFLTKIFLGKLLCFRTVNAWAISTQKIYQMCKNNNSKLVTVPAGRGHFFGELYLREDFVETTECMFEGYQWKIPKSYDYYLTRMYGDYTQIPPEEDREGHLIFEFKFPQ